MAAQVPAQTPARAPMAHGAGLQGPIVRGAGGWRMPDSPARRKYCAELAGEALQALSEIVREGPRVGRGVDSTVSAARGLLEHHRWLEEVQLADERPLRELTALLGSDAAALQWMREKIPELEERVGNPALEEETQGERNEDAAE